MRYTIGQSFFKIFHPILIQFSFSIGLTLHLMGFKSRLKTGKYT